MTFARCGRLFGFQNFAARQANAPLPARAVINQGFELAGQVSFVIPARAKPDVLRPKGQSAFSIFARLRQFEIACAHRLHDLAASFACQQLPAKKLRGLRAARVQQQFARFAAMLDSPIQQQRDAVGNCQRFALIMRHEEGCDL